MLEKEDQLLFDLHTFYVNLLSRNVISELQKLKENHFLLSGDDSGLTNVWEEICVQVQFEYSHSWDAYEDTILKFVSDEFGKQPIVIQNILNYVASINDSESEVVPDSNDTIKEIYETILTIAADFTNQRISRFIDQDDDYEEE
jgi:hypothetical protein